MIKTEKQRKDLIRWIMAVKRGRMEKFIIKEEDALYKEEDVNEDSIE